MLLGTIRQQTPEDDSVLKFCEYYSASMWPALTVSGFMILGFGIFLVFVTGVLGITIFLGGLLMIVAGTILKEPKPPTPDAPNKRYCKFCMAEVDSEPLTCPECGFVE